MEQGGYRSNCISDVSSDIHIEKDSWKGDDEMFVSRYEIALPAEEVVEREKGRRRKKNSCFIILHHMNKTPLDNVGKQLWRGSLLLSDYIIHMRASFSNKTLVELGCGIGFVSKIASLLKCERIFMTDATTELVDIAVSNIDRNSHLLPIHKEDVMCSPVQGRVLNWLSPTNTRTQLSISDGWTENDMEHLSSPTTEVLWLAADVIYDDEITEGFFQTCIRCMKPGEHLWMALEKRFNFSIEELSVVAHGYRRFLSYVNEQDYGSATGIHGNCDRHRGFFVGHRLPLNIPQSVLCYDRVKDLEMWDIVRTEHVILDH